MKNSIYLSHLPYSTWSAIIALQIVSIDMTENKNMSSHPLINTDDTTCDEECKDLIANQAQTD